MRALYLPLAKSHIQFPFLISFQRISPRPRLCEICRNAVSCQVVDFLATRPATILEDTHCRMSAAVHSTHYRLPSISGDPLLHHNLSTRRTVFTWTHLVRLMIHHNCHHYHLHHPVFSVPVTVLFKIFIHQADLTSIINALTSWSITDSVLILILLLIPF
jgi:hypothetical protein